jgi:UDP-N-acetylglucosamine 2-epimerase
MFAVAAFKRNRLIWACPVSHFESMFAYVARFKLAACSATERPVTTEIGTNLLVHPTTHASDIVRLAEVHIQLMASQRLRPAEIDLWDGRASERIVQHIVTLSTSRMD